MNSTSFDWSLVRAFLAAMEHGSLLAAARDIGTSQPTLGRHIAELERQLSALDRAGFIDACRLRLTLSGLAAAVSMRATRSRSARITRVAA